MLVPSARHTGAVAMDGEQEQPSEHGPASAGTAPAVYLPVTGSIQPIAAGSAAGSPQSTHSDRMTTRMVVPSARHSGVEAIDGAQARLPGVLSPPGAHGTGETGMGQSSGWA
ncbi:hypothetical protein [Streptomyces sp. NPDC095817]|uniref:hypothetical protein n=1 Tax=Streptomyces sp. NPDC095817 TaxID=3155082 RepID=UPI0033294082